MRNQNLVSGCRVFGCVWRKGYRPLGLVEDYELSQEKGIGQVSPPPVRYPLQRAYTVCNSSYVRTYCSAKSELLTSSISNVGGQQVTRYQGFTVSDVQGQIWRSSLTRNGPPFALTTRVRRTGYVCIIRLCCLNVDFHNSIPASVYTTSEPDKKSGHERVKT